MEKDGKLIGVSPLAIYSSNVRGWISLAMINEADLSYGDQVELTWGEPDGGSANPWNGTPRPPSARPLRNARSPSTELGSRLVVATSRL